MTFSRSNRREREDRRERSNYVSGGPGFRFCQKHRQRYPIASMCPTCIPPVTARNALMPYFGRTERARARQSKREVENAWVICPTHGGYNPWQRTLGGMRRGECPKCQAARYEAAVRPSS